MDNAYQCIPVLNCADQAVELTCFEIPFLATEKNSLYGNTVDIQVNEKGRWPDPLWHDVADRADLCRRSARDSDPNLRGR